MDAIYLLIPLTLIILAAAIAIFFWAINSDQYSDLDKEASQILFDDEAAEISSEQAPKKSSEQFSEQSTNKEEQQ